MKYCPNCGKKVKPTKFCSKCGSKHKPNVIDDKLDTIRAIRNDVSDSKYVSKIKNKSVRIAAKFFVTLGYFSIIILTGQLISVVFFSKNLLCVQSYLNIISINESLFYKILVLTAETLPSTILPLYLIYVAGKIRKNVAPFFWIFLLMFIIISLQQITSE